MRKTILFGLSVLFALTGYAQLKVDSIGNVEVSKQATIASLEVNKDYANSTGATIYGTTIVNGNNTVNSPKGIQCNIGSDTAILPIGINASISSSRSNSSVYGIKAITCSTNRSVSVYGGLHYSYQPQQFAAIYGNTTLNTVTPPDGIYAGFFCGDVKTTGTIYGTLISPSSISSPSGGGTTTNLSKQSPTRGESITEKLQQVDLLQMERMNQNGSLPANKEEEKRVLTEEERAELGEDADHADDEPIQTRLSDTSYGLAADQLQEVFPELVYEDAEGNFSINYVEMVPLLVQSIRELSGKVAALEAQLGSNEQTKPILKTKGKTEDVDNVILTLPDKMQEATLNVYNLSGNLLRTVPLGASDAASLSSYTHGLPTGTYVYSLTVDGKKQRARKVIVR